MNYKYPPVYKYIILLILITTFLRYYKTLSKNDFLLIAGIFTYMVFIFDYVLINNHPALLDDKQEEAETKKIIYVKKDKPKKERKEKKIKVIDENKELIPEDSMTEFDLASSKLESPIDKELKELDDLLGESDNLTEEIQRELDELDLD